MTPFEIEVSETYPKNIAMRPIDSRIKKVFLRDFIFKGWVEVSYNWKDVFELFVSSFLTDGHFRNFAIRTFEL